MIENADYIRAEMNEKEIVILTDDGEIFYTYSSESVAELANRFVKRTTLWLVNVHTIDGDPIGQMILNSNHIRRFMEKEVYQSWINR